uniref:Armadillo repeat-containing protein 8 n=1 Tax=Chrysemys picta bellii TaxID=8478 RepID=A0A8C3FPH4_CHRPI
MACVLETPLRMSVLSEVTASSRHYVDRLFDPDPQKVLQGVIDMKNAVIGNNKQKANLIVLGAVPRLLYLLQQETSSTELRTECAVVLGSLAMGTENNVKSLLDCHIIPALLQGLLSPELKFIEACLRCLRTIFTSPVTPEELLYTVSFRQCIFALVYNFCSCNATCIMCGPDHQTILFNHGAVQNIAHLLSSTSYKQAINCRAVQLSLPTIPYAAPALCLGAAPGSLLVAVQGGKKGANVRVSPPPLLYPISIEWGGRDMTGLRTEGASWQQLRSQLADLLKKAVYLVGSAYLKGQCTSLSLSHTRTWCVSLSISAMLCLLPPFMLSCKVLQNAPDEVLVVASSTLCNLLLEFSPSKEPILESGAIELLCSLTQSENLALRVNGIWALMNMAFQAEQKIKADILQGLSTEQLFQLLSDSDVNVLMKTLGLLRNLLSTRPHIDQIMSTHGKQIMQAVTLILEGEHNIEVKEQTLCILANIADGTTAKELIMTNDDILQKIKYYMSHSNAKLQLAAMFCISNLIWNEEEGSQERQDKLRDIGIVDILHKLSQSSDPNLCDKAKTALQQYLA